MEHKAFENLEFLQSSADARPLRILSEYIYPQHNLEKEQITDTVVVCGSARIPPKKSENRPADFRGSLAEGLADSYEQARSLSREITAWSLQNSPEGRKLVVCTGGGPGIMEASNQGAKEAGGQTIGFNIELPGNHPANPYISPELLFQFRYFFMRKFWFLYHVRVMVFFPGGFGTMDELFEALTLQQTGAIKNKFYIILFGREFWEKIIDFESLAEAGLVAEKDLELFDFADSVQDALAKILPILKNALG